MPEGDTIHPAGPLDVVDALRAERALFVELLRSLEAADWRRPTECPAYDVQGVAAHLLGDDLSLLSRQRDGAEQGLLRFLEGAPSFRAALDGFNDHWVETARFFGHRLLVDLLEVTGAWSADWYAAVDPMSLGEPVGFFGATGPSPYWQIAAREYAERWIHHHQIRRAVGRPEIGDAQLLAMALAVAVRGIAAHLRALDAGVGDTVVLSVDGLAAWTLVRHDEIWQLLEGAAASPTSVVRLDASTAATALFRGMGAAQVEGALTVEGAADLGRRVARGIAALSGR